MWLLWSYYKHHWLISKRNVTKHDFIILFYLLCPKPWKFKILVLYFCCVSLFLSLNCECISIPCSSAPTMAEDKERITAWLIPAGAPTTATTKPQDKPHNLQYQFIKLLRLTVNNIIY